MINPWKRIEPTTLIKVDRRQVVLKTFKLTDGHTQTFATFLPEGSRAGGVIALTPDNKVIVAKQFRVGPQKVMWDIPGGGIEEGEDPQKGVMRELREETGYASNEVEFLGTNCRDAYTNCTWYYYIARNCQPLPEGQQLDEHEIVDIELLTIEQFLQNAKTDLMTDPAAVLFAYDKLKEIQHAANSH